MTADEFLTSMETILRTRPVKFSRASLQCFVASCQELILDRQEPAFWCERFLETSDVMAPA
jgi:hypothetical protein